MRLERLCEMELAYEGGFTLIRPYGGQEGAGYGAGTGTVRGERLSGTVRWVNHPRRRGDGAMLPDAHGVIQTDDGATVLFSLSGRTFYGEDRQGRQTQTVLFEAEDERYRWLNSAYCVLEGLIDGARLVMRGHVLACINELA